MLKIILSFWLRTWVGFGGAAEEGWQSWGKWVQAVVKMWKAAGLLAWASLSLE